jgi:hypothetical protein
MIKIVLNINLYVLCCICFILNSEAQEAPYIKVLFENSSMPESHYFSNATYEGDSWIRNINHKIPVTENHAFTPGNALFFEYVSSKNGRWNVDIFYDSFRGMTYFMEADIMSFWLYLDDKNTKVSLPELGLILENDEPTNTIVLSEYTSSLKVNTWQQVIVPLDVFKTGIKTEAIKGVKLSQSSESTETKRFYIDQIEFLPEVKNQSANNEAPKLIKTQGYEQHVDLQWEPIKDASVRYVKIYRQEGDNTFNYVGIQSPWITGFTDYIGVSTTKTFNYKISYLYNDYKESATSKVLNAETHKMTDEELLDMVQQSHFRYYWDGAEPNSGLALENIPGKTSMIATGASGFGMMAIIVGVHRNFISREDAVKRFLKITRFLNKADRFHGVYPHFLDGSTGKTVPFFGAHDNGGDLVENSFLMQGLLTARQFFNKNNEKEKEIRQTITKLWEAVEWDWYKQYPDSDFLYWHWSPDQAWTINHKLIGWNETMITYFLAIASPKHGVPASMYYSGWASPSQEAQKYRTDWGKTEDGSHYTNGNTYYGVKLPVGVSNGGPLFFTHYSFFGLNPHKLTDRYCNYFENNKRIAEINLRYCIENPKNYQGYGDDFWGLTASDGPKSYSPNEPNIRNDIGKMTPTGALSSFPYTPEASMKALKNYYFNYGKDFYGYYGFYDAIALNDNWRSSLYMGLNQAPIVVMIENYRSGLIWNLFMQNEDVQNGLNKLGFNH